MRLRVVDYAGNEGGGIRFASELMVGFARAGVELELVSHGGALERYRRALVGAGAVRVLDVPPEGKEWEWRRKQTMPVVGALWRALGIYGHFHYEVPERALEGCEVAWFPWLHRHRVPARWAERCVASLHDLIMIEFRSSFPKVIVESETETLRCWLRSRARIVVSAEATAATLARLLGTSRERLDVVPLAGMHRHAAGPPPPDGVPSVAEGPFLLFPANTSPHKNHDNLLDGFARWGARWPLVLTGGGTDLEGGSRRAVELRARLERLGLARGRDVHGLGFVDDSAYYAILRRARALVMPTLAEGGGSFPVWEALFEGIPVVCSDIPVLREMMDRVGGEVLWFDPRDPDALARRLRDLEERHDEIRARARSQVATLRQRSWEDVARDYAPLMSARENR